MTLAPPPELRTSARPATAAGRAPERQLTAVWIAIILLGHGVYGLLLARSAALATAHALITFAVGIWFALTSTMRRVAIICAYMAGSEILWRLGHARLPWEFVKYAIFVLIVLTLIRVRRLHWDVPALAYIGFLMPSTVLSFLEEDFDVAREQVSFNMSGPLLLCMSTWFFGLLRPSRADFQRLALAIMAPVLSLGFVAVTRAASLEDLTFGDASNFQLSAGYGPNQVSTMLALGTLLAILLLVLIERGVRERLLLAVVGGVLGVQSALTFSRGGLFATIGALLIAAPFLLKGSRNRIALVAGALALVATVEVVVLPQLDAFTGGALGTRFQDTNTTGRYELMQAELETFSAHPFFGSGPAALDEYRGDVSSVHTEFTRLLAQHGIFGVLALLTMLLLAWRAASGQQSAAARAISVALIVWSFLTMTHAAMRLAITPFAFGMAAALYFSPRGERGAEQERPVAPTPGSADIPSPPRRIG